MLAQDFGIGGSIAAHADACLWTIAGCVVLHLLLSWVLLSGALRTAGRPAALSVVPICNAIALRGATPRPRAWAGRCALASVPLVVALGATFELVR